MNSLHRRTTATRKPADAGRIRTAATIVRESDDGRLRKVLGRPKRRYCSISFVVRFVLFSGWCFLSIIVLVAILDTMEFDLDLTPLLRRTGSKEVVEQKNDTLAIYLLKKLYLFDVWLEGEAGSPPSPKKKPPPPCQFHNISLKTFTVNETIVPFVFMVHKRVKYLQAAMESLRASDFPSASVPVIVSHDGNVKEMVDYVNTLKDEGYFHIVQLFHPHSCYDHPKSFPGDDSSLNEGFAGDTYGNPRTASITCCKHHFTWMLNKVFQLDFGDDEDDDSVVDHFLFTEEDYLVSPTVYATIIRGLNAIDQFETEFTEGAGFLGVALTATTAQKPRLFHGESFNIAPFTSGPMTLSRRVFERFRNHAAAEYCQYDDYNWDWSMVHLTNSGLLPHCALFPGKPQAQHIGLEDGMHSKNATAKQHHMSNAKTSYKVLTNHFNGERLCFRERVAAFEQKKPNGGWGHSRDQQHCLDLFNG